MSTSARIAVHPRTTLRAALALADAQGYDMVLDNGRAYLYPREPATTSPNNLIEINNHRSPHNAR